MKKRKGKERKGEKRRRPEENKRRENLKKKERNGSWGKREELEKKHVHHPNRTGQQTESDRSKTKKQTEPGTIEVHSRNTQELQ